MASAFSGFLYIYLPLRCLHYQNLDLSEILYQYETLPVFHWWCHDFFQAFRKKSKGGIIIKCFTNSAMIFLFGQKSKIKLNKNTFSIIVVNFLVVNEDFPVSECIFLDNTDEWPMWFSINVADNVKGLATCCKFNGD